MPWVRHGRVNPLRKGGEQRMNTPSRRPWAPSHTLSLCCCDRALARGCHFDCVHQRLLYHTPPPPLPLAPLEPLPPLALKRRSHSHSQQLIIFKDTVQLSRA